ncbi:putative oxidoreductase GLYR1 [Trichonephila clavipes]|nr:putative oxidoreductase GLYR1 [Trichonephila clavipes]
MRHFSDECDDTFNILFQSVINDMQEAHRLIASKPKPANEDSLSDDELTKNCTEALNSKEIVKNPSISKESHKTSQKTNGSRKFKKTNKKAKKTPKIKKFAQVESDQKLSKMSDDSPGQNSTTEVNQPTDEYDMDATTSEYSSDDYLELPLVRNTFLGKNTKETPKNIGFLGMEMFGQRIEEYPLDSGHGVSISNTTPEKYEKLVKARVQLCSTPSEVVCNKKAKKTPKIKKFAQVESDQKLSKMSDDSPGQNSTTEVNQPTDEYDMDATTSEYSSDDYLELPLVRNTFLGNNTKETLENIGFLGMGMFGQRIVEQLLDSGHGVSIWNTTPEKYEKLVKARVQLCSTPSEVVCNCDIIFVCVSSSGLEKSLEFLDEDVLQEHCEPGSKTCIKCTFPDPNTSKEITEYIINYAGKDGSA